MSEPIESALIAARGLLHAGRRYEGAGLLYRARRAAWAGVLAASSRGDAAGGARMRELYNAAGGALSALETLATVEPTRSIRIPFVDPATNMAFGVLGPAQTTLTLRVPARDFYDYDVERLIIDLRPAPPGGVVESISVTDLSVGGSSSLLLSDDPIHATSFDVGSSDRPVLLRRERVGSDDFVQLRLQTDVPPAAQVVVIAALKAQITRDTIACPELATRVPPYFRVPMQVATADGLNAVGSPGFYLTPATATVPLISGEIPSRPAADGLHSAVVIGVEVSQLTQLQITDVGVLSNLRQQASPSVFGSDDVPMDLLSGNQVGALLRPGLRYQTEVTPLRRFTATASGFDGLTGGAPLDTIFVQGLNLLCAPAVLDSLP